MIPYIQAPFEADPVIIFLCEKKMIDGVIASDADYIAAGLVVHDHFTSRFKGRAYSPSLVLPPDAPLEARQFQHIQKEGLLPVLAVLLGNDYIGGLSSFHAGYSLESIIAALSNSNLRAGSSISDVLNLFPRKGRKKNSSSAPSDAWLPNGLLSAATSEKFKRALWASRHAWIFDVTVAPLGALVFFHHIPSSTLPGNRNAIKEYVGPKDNAREGYGMSPRFRETVVIPTDLSLFSPSVLTAGGAGPVALEGLGVAGGDLNARQQRRALQQLQHPNSPWIVPFLSDAATKSEAADRLRKVMTVPEGTAFRSHPEYSEDTPDFSRLAAEIFIVRLMQAPQALIKADGKDGPADIQDFQVAFLEGGILFAKGKIASQVSKAVYDVGVRVSHLPITRNGEPTRLVTDITDFFCSCIAGLACCKHTACMLLKLSDFCQEARKQPSSTSLPQSWGIPSQKARNIPRDQSELAKIQAQRGTKTISKYIEIFTIVDEGGQRPTAEVIRKMPDSRHLISYNHVKPASATKRKIQEIQDEE